MGYRNLIMGFASMFILVSLPVTLYLANNTQDVRQQAASSSVILPTPTPSGCPDYNDDGSTNTCRAQKSCNFGEEEIAGGATQCSEILRASAVCCKTR